MWPFPPKKKIPVPLPPSEDLLSFPKPLPLEKEISLEKTKKPLVPDKIPFTPDKLSLPPAPVFAKKYKISEPFKQDFLPPNLKIKPAFFRVQHYQLILENLNQVKNQVNNLGTLTDNLEKSEFNEDKNYEVLKNDLQKIHERLLFMDDLIFKR